MCPFSTESHDFLNKTNTNGGEVGEHQCESCDTSSLEATPSAAALTDWEREREKKNENAKNFVCLRH